MYTPISDILILKLGNLASKADRLTLSLWVWPICFLRLDVYFNNITSLSQLQSPLRTVISQPSALRIVIDVSSRLKTVDTLPPSKYLNWPLVSW